MTNKWSQQRWGLSTKQIALSFAGLNQWPNVNSGSVDEIWSRKIKRGEQTNTCWSPSHKSSLKETVLFNSHAPFFLGFCICISYKGLYYYVVVFFWGWRISRSKISQQQKSWLNTGVCLVGHVLRIRSHGIHHHEKPPCGSKICGIVFQQISETNTTYSLSFEDEVNQKQKLAPIPVANGVVPLTNGLIKWVAGVISPL